MEATPRRAVVIGASMAGLLAARVLSAHFDEVVLLERDALPDGPGLRRGTPQAAHAHGLLARGQQILESLFPGFTERLVAQGAVCGDIGSQVILRSDRQRFASRPQGTQGICASRCLIEAELRNRVAALPGVTLIDRARVIEPVHDSRGGRVTGLRWALDGLDAEARELAAALVIDCSGRGSHSPQWLRDWGYDAPQEERVTVRIGYATQYVERPPSPPPLAAVICTASPGLPLPGVLLAQEPEGGGPARWVVTLGGYGPDALPADADAMLARARAMGSPEIEEVLAQGRPLGPVQRYSFPHSQRRRYERLKRFPAGYLVLGDAITSFNPIYGQGMTVAACEAEALGRALRGGLDGLHRRFFPAAAKAIDIPWQLAVGADLALPQVQGPLPLPLRIVNAYVARLQRAAVHDAEVAAAFGRVMHLLAAPGSLFAPGILWRVWRRGGRGAAPMIRLPAPTPRHGCPPVLSPNLPPTSPMPGNRR